MKNQGKIIEYDNYTGKILSVDGKNYLFTANDLLDHYIIVGDYVEFDGEVYQDIEYVNYRAHFIKKVINKYYEKENRE